MRDARRIEVFCNRLARVWEMVPDWRFGQFVCNMFGKLGKDPFYIEDEPMIEFFEKQIDDMLDSVVKEGTENE